MTMGVYNLDKKYVIFPVTFVIFVLLGLGPQSTSSEPVASRMQADIVKMKDDIYDIAGPDYGPARRPNRRHVGLDDIDDPGEEGVIADGAAIANSVPAKGERDDQGQGFDDEKAFPQDVVPFRRRGGRGREVVGAASSSEEVDKLENPGAVNSEGKAHVHSAAHNEKRGANTETQSSYSAAGAAVQADAKGSSQVAPTDAPASAAATNSHLVAATDAPASASKDTPHISPTNAPAVAATDAPQIAPTDAPASANKHVSDLSAVNHGTSGSPGKAIEQAFPVKENHGNRETHAIRAPGSAVSSTVERLVPDLGSIGALDAQAVKMDGPHHITVKHVIPDSPGNSASNAGNPEESNPSPTQVTQAVASHGDSPASTRGASGSGNKQPDVKLRVSSTHSINPAHELSAGDEGAPVVGGGPKDDIHMDFVSSELEMQPRLQMGRYKRAAKKALSLETDEDEDPVIFMGVQPRPELKFGKHKRSIEDSMYSSESESNELEMLPNLRMGRRKRSPMEPLRNNGQGKIVPNDLKMAKYWKSVRTLRGILHEIGNKGFVSPPKEKALPNFLMRRQKRSSPEQPERTSPDLKMGRRKRSVKDNTAENEIIPNEGAGQDEDPREEIISNEVELLPRSKKLKRSIQPEPEKIFPNLRMGKLEPIQGLPNLRMGRRKRSISKDLEDIFPNLRTGKLEPNLISPSLRMGRRKRSVAEAKSPVQLYLETKSERLATLTSEPALRSQRETKRTHAKSKFPQEFCELERDSGVICPKSRRGPYLEQFYYESATNRCYHFVYNGCGGNANRFSSLWECTQSCTRQEGTK